MPRILVLYGSTNGQTGKIARFIGERLVSHGLETDVIDAAKAFPNPDLYGAIIVAASLHAGGYQRAVQHWVRRSAPALVGKHTAFVSVCLGVLQHEPAVQRELTSILNKFLAATGWQPTVTRMVAGALPYTRYNWITRWMMKRIVRKAGGDTDTSRDYEYTDWDDLRAFIEQFAGAIARQPAPSLSQRSA
jgi:menaquinone-dependent protoporphyrinogen oxidase